MTKPKASPYVLLLSLVPTTSDAAEQLRTSHLSARRADGRLGPLSASRVQQTNNKSYLLPSLGQRTACKHSKTRSAAFVIIFTSSGGIKAGKVAFRTKAKKCESDAGERNSLQAGKRQKCSDQMFSFQRTVPGALKCTRKMPKGAEGAKMNSKGHPVFVVYAGSNCQYR